MSGLQVVIPDFEDLESYSNATATQAPGTAVPSAASASNGRPAFNNRSASGSQDGTAFGFAASANGGIGNSTTRGPFRGAELWHGRNGSESSGGYDLPSPISSTGPPMPPPMSSSAFSSHGQSQPLFPSLSQGVQLPDAPSASAPNRANNQSQSQQQQAPRKGSLASLRAAFKSAASSAVTAVGSTPSYEPPLPTSSSTSFHQHGRPSLGGGRPSLDRERETRQDLSTPPTRSTSQHSIRYFPSSSTPSGRQQYDGYQYQYSHGHVQHQRTESPASLGNIAASNAWEGNTFVHGHSHKRSQLSGSSSFGAASAGAGSSIDASTPTSTSFNMGMSMPPPLPPFPPHLQSETRGPPGIIGAPTLSYYAGIPARGGGLPDLFEGHGSTSRSHTPQPSQYRQLSSAAPLRPPIQLSDDSSYTLPHGVGVADPSTPAQYALNVLLARFSLLARSRLKSLASKSNPDFASASFSVPFKRGRNAFSSIWKSVAEKENEVAFESVCRCLSKAANNSDPQQLQTIWASLWAWRSLHETPNSTISSNINQTDPLSHGVSASMFEDDDTIPSGTGTNITPSNASKAQLRNNAAQVRKAKLLSIVVLLDALTILFDGLPRHVIEDAKTASLSDLGGKSYVDFAPEVDAIGLLGEAMILRLPQEDGLILRVHHSLGDLLGVLSQARLVQVCDTLTMMLQKSLAATASQKEGDPEVELQIKLIGKLKITVFPMEVFEEGAEAILSLVRLFSSAHGTRVKIAFAEALAAIVLQVASRASAELHHPTWVEVTDVLWSRAQVMSAKPRYWAASFALGTAVLCASREETFLQQWWPFLENSLQQLKDRSRRKTVVESATRLLWVYLFRCKESSNATSKRLDAFFRIWFPMQRRSIDLQDTGSDIYALMLHHILYRQSEIGRDFVLELLRASSLQGNMLTLQPELINKRRMVAAVRAISLTRQAYADKSSPSFPLQIEEEFKLPQVTESAPAEIEWPTTAIAQAHATFEGLIGKIALICDHQVGEVSVLDERAVLSSGSGSGSHLDSEYMDNDKEGLVWRFHEDMGAMAAYSHVHQPFMDVLRACLSVWPQCLTTKLPRNVVFGVILRSLWSADSALASTATGTIHRVSICRDYSMDALAYIGRYLVRPDVVMWEVHPNRQHLTQKTTSVFKLWAACFNRWKKHVELSCKPPVSSDGVQSTNMARAGEWTTLDEAEAHSLFLMTFPVVALRRIGASVLESVSLVDTTLSGREASTAMIGSLHQANRVWHLLELPIKRSLEGDTLVTSAHSLFDSDTPVEAVLQAREAINGIAWHQIQGLIFRQCATLFPTVTALVKANLASRVLNLQNYLSSSTGLPAHLSTKAAQANLDGIAETWAHMASCLAAISTDANVGGMDHQGHARQSSDTAPEPKSFTSTDLVQQLVLLACSGRPLVAEKAQFASAGLNRHLFYACLQQLRKVSVDAGDEEKRQATISKPDTLPVVRHKVANVRKGTALILQTIIPYITLLDSSHRSNEVFLVLAWIKETLLFLSDPVMRNDLQQNPIRLAFARVTSCFVDSLALEGSLQRYFSTDTIMQIFLLCLEWQSYSPHNAQGSAKLANLLTSAAYRRKDEQSRSRVLNELRDLVHGLAHAAAETLASLSTCIPITEFRNPQEQQDTQLPWVSTVGWARMLVKAPLDAAREPAHRAVRNVLSAQKDVVLAWNNVIDLIHGEESPTRFEQSFFGDLHHFKDEAPAAMPLGRLLVLLVSKLSDPDVQVRRLAFDWLSQYDDAIAPHKCDCLQLTPAGYLYGMHSVCNALQLRLGDSALFIAAECGSRVAQAPPAHRESFANLVGNALKNVRLDLSGERGYASETYVLLSNFLWVATHQVDADSRSLQSCVESICTAHVEGNVNVLLRFLLDINLHVHHPMVLHASCTIVTLLCRKWADVFRRAACDALVPASAIPLLIKNLSYEVDPSHASLHVPDFRASLRVPEETSSVSAAGLLLCFLSVCGIPESCSDECKAQVLHVATLHAKMPWTPGQTSSGSLIRQILGADILVSRKHLNSDSACDLLRVDQLPHWDRATGLGDQWRRAALVWATVNPVRALACHSFVILRDLKPMPSIESLAEILGRLSATISDQSDDFRLFTIEAMKTLTAMASVTSADKECSHDFSAACFWACAAAVGSANESECADALILMEAILNKVNTAEGVDASGLLRWRPVDWESNSPDWSHSILYAFRSSCTQGRAMSVVSKVLQGPVFEVLADRDAWLGLSLIAILPHFALTTETTDVSPKAAYDIVLLIAALLGRCFEQAHRPDLQRFCEAVANRRFKITDDLIRQGISGLRAHFLPAHCSMMAQIALGSVLTPDATQRSSALKVAKAFLQGLGSSQSLLAEDGSDLWMPLLRSLSQQDALAQDALDCLSLTSRITGGPDHRQLMRMSLQWCKTELSHRELQGTVRVFGPPSATGWSIPDRQEAAMRARSNIQSVFRICERTLDVAPAAVHVDFVEDASEGSVWSHSESTRAETQHELGDLVSQLHDLSNFFVADALSATNPGASLSRSNTQTGTLSRSNTHAGRDPQKQVAKVVSRSAAPASSNPSTEWPVDSFGFATHSSLDGQYEPVVSPKNSQRIDLVQIPEYQNELPNGPYML
ncbi:hypothetical protein K437DRAFT_292525 [Tilletiaria anomala UBC 951]|uniref:Cell morphogenesis protein n=1 Tax=Tilletiaria anomala (strain ATCC 24038 / CBS 436.72 / UBC 951) TaxID=1037660 RepID=A0A066WKI1_TILAU|nr:uncharacterized protein K437DRAFT_292525 [Tilletiaria anomala UBC 951]KDN53083.1 hypothetical protein K437DRAFT_292525 [Tilletiaria anomala UBC 951]